MNIADSSNNIDNNLSIDIIDNIDDTDYIHLKSNVLKDDSSIETDSGSEEISNNETDKNSEELYNRIINANDNETVLIEPGVYRIHNLHLIKNITLQGNGNPRDVIIDGEQLGSIFLINSIETTARFYNLTIMNGLTGNFGGGICVETGNTYVDNCIFINNTALKNTNGGAISNYGNETNRSYLFVNNTLFIGNHADHDGGAVTTCYAIADMYNCLFVNNSARRDGGAIRVSVYGYGNVQDCVFVANHADEWGGAYYSWAGNSSIDRCIFVNNTAGTNGGAVMVSGSLNLTNSLITNNTGGETGGSFYIQQPMFDAKTVMKVNNNIITNNSSPLGKEIYLKWDATKLLFPNFNDNDWGDEDPTSSDVVDPNNLSNRIKPTSTKKISNLYEKLNWGLLDSYSDILDDYYGRTPSNSNNTEKNTDNTNTPGLKVREKVAEGLISNSSREPVKNVLNKSTINKSVLNNNSSGSGSSKDNSSSNYVSPGSDTIKAVELFEDNPVASKSTDIRYFVVLAIVVFVFLLGLSRRRSDN